MKFKMLEPCNIHFYLLNTSFVHYNDTGSLNLYWLLLAKLGF